MICVVVGSLSFDPREEEEVKPLEGPTESEKRVDEVAHMTFVVRGTCPGQSAKTAVHIT